MGGHGTGLFIEMFHIVVLNEVAEEIIVSGIFVLNPVHFMYNHGPTSFRKVFSFTHCAHIYIYVSKSQYDRDDPQRFSCIPHHVSVGLSSERDNITSIMIIKPTFGHII